MNMLRATLLAVLVVALIGERAIARGGGRGGGGFHGGRGGGFGGGAGGLRPGELGGGGFRPQGQFGGANRSPSFSTPSVRPETFYPSRMAGGGDRIGNFQYRPNNLTRPGGGDRINLGDRTGVADRANLGDRTNLGNRGDLAGRLDGNRPLRPGEGNWRGNFINHDNWHHGNWHGHWNNNWWWHRPAWWWGFGAGWAAGAAYGAVVPWAWGYWSYDNPYATEPYVAGDTTINYSEPILAMDDSSAPADAQTSDQASTADLASQSFDAARKAFTQEDYQAALDAVDQAIAQTPADPVLHEFRGLVLFAMGNYNEAAAAIYGVLSAGPGWDWTTLSSLYPTIDLFTRQLRALESYSKAHPDEADAAFLLAYEYLTMGSTDAAIAELRQVVRLNPKDQLSAQLLSSLTAKPEDQPPQADKPDAAATPVTARQLAGDWTITRPDGSSIKLVLGADSQYTWTYNSGGQSSSHSGKYSVADNLLVLNQDDSPAMAGQVSDVSNRSFNFRLVGASPSDPGLTFTR